MPPKADPYVYHVYRSFIGAVHHGDTVEVYKLLNRGMRAHLNQVPRGCSGQSFPLEKAVQHGQVEVTRVLLEQGADPTLDFKLSILQRALKSKHRVELLRLLLVHGADVNKLSPVTLLSQTVDGSVLHAVVQPSTCKAGVLELLLEHGADVNLAFDGKTLLMTAASDPHNPKAVKMLLEHGALVDVHDARHGAALHCAVRRCRDSKAHMNRQIKVMRLLLQHGTNVNLGAGTSSGTALHAAASKMHGSPLLHCYRVCRMLLDAGVDVDAVDSVGETAFHHSVWSSKSALTELLLDRGSDIDAVDCSGSTALMRCASHMRLDIVQQLINRGAALNVQGKNGDTALHLATCTKFAGRGPDSVAKRERMCRLLVDAGADPLVRNQAGHTAEDVCDLWRRHEVKQLLQEAANKARLATLLVGLRMGASGGESNSLTRLEQHALFDANVLGMVADALTGSGSKRVTRRAASSSSSSASSSPSATSRPTKRTRLE